MNSGNVVNYAPNLEHRELMSPFHTFDHADKYGPFGRTSLGNQMPNSTSVGSLHPNTTMDPKVVLLLIIDHGKAWGNGPHQALVNQLRASHYNPIASNPAGALTAITRYNPAIILVMEANTIDQTCNRSAINKQLRNFTKAGGVVIFGGVPHALCPPKKAEAKVFTLAFHIRDWTVDNTFETDIEDATGLMQSPRLSLNATYLKNVAVGARVYRCPNFALIEDDEPCAVAIQAYGQGCMGYFGSVDLFSVESRFILMTMIEISLSRSGRTDGKSPAEFLSGGEIWHPPGWHDPPGAAMMSGGLS